MVDENANGSETGRQGNGAAGNAGPVLDKATALGHAVWLMSQSPLHKYSFIQDIEWLLVPPIAHGQFRLWLDGTKPQGFATWAYVSDEADARVRQGVKRLAPKDWKSGPHLWLMDIITPFGGMDRAIADLNTVVFKDQSVKTLKLAAGGKPEVVTLADLAGQPAGAPSQA